MHPSIKKQTKNQHTQPRPPPPPKKKKKQKKTKKQQQQQQQKTKQKKTQQQLPRSLNNFHIWRLSTLRWAAATPIPHKRNIL